MNQAEFIVDYEHHDTAVLQFDCGCELRIFPRNDTGGLIYGFGNCKHQTHQGDLSEILRFSDGILLTKFYISRGKERVCPPAPRGAKVEAPAPPKPSEPTVCAHEHKTYRLGNTYCDDCKIWLHAGPQQQVTVSVPVVRSPEDEAREWLKETRDWDRHGRGYIRKSDNRLEFLPETMAAFARHAREKRQAGFICAKWKKLEDGCVARCDQAQGHDGRHLDSVIDISWDAREKGLL